MRIVKLIEYRLLSPLIWSCYRLDLYAKSIQEPGIFALMFYFFFAIILTFAQCSFIFLINENNPQINHAPTITLTNGQASSSESNPYYFINNPKALIVYDISEKLTLPDPKSFDLILVFQKNGYNEYTYMSGKYEFTPYSKIVDYWFTGSDTIIVDAARLKEFSNHLILVTSGLLFLWNILIRFIFLIIISTYIYVILDSVSKKYIIGLRQLLVIGTYSLIPTTYIMLFISLISHRFLVGTSYFVTHLPIWLLFIIGLYRKYPDYFTQKRTSEEDLMKQDIKIEADQIGQVNVNSTVYNLDKLKNLQPESKEQFIEAVMEIRSVIRKMEEDGRINAEKAADIDHSLHKVKIEAEKPDPSKVKIKKYLQQVRKLVEEVSPYTSMTADLITIIAPIILVLDKIF